MIIKESIALAVLSFYSLVRHLMCMSTFLLQPYPASDVFEYSAFVSGDACGAQSGYFLYSCKKVLDVCIFMLLYIPAFSMRICDGAGTAENHQHCQGGMHICGEEEALEDRMADIRSVNRRSDIRRYRLSGESATSMINTVFR